MPFLNIESIHFIDTFQGCYNQHPFPKSHHLCIGENHVLALGTFVYSLEILKNGSVMEAQSVKMAFKAQKSAKRKGWKPFRIYKRIFQRPIVKREPSKNEK